MKQLNLDFDVTDLNLKAEATGRGAKSNRAYTAHHRYRG